MSTQVTTVPLAARKDPNRGHRLRLTTGFLVSGTLMLSLAIYGFNYYTAPMSHRILSAKHDLLKPSGTIGIRLGILGFFTFCGIFLYPLRKRWQWLAGIGSTKHWLDFHILMGLSAPFIIAFHSSFKFRGLAGLAFWIMVSVATSGVIGRYLYGQIPRTLNAAELSLKELEGMQEQLSALLAEQDVVLRESLDPLFALPSRERIDKLPMLVSFAWMVDLDLARPFRVAHLRRRALTLGEDVVSLGGLLPSTHPDLERVIALARRKAALAKRVLFLSRAQQIFHLWHVVHRPFSYSFVCLAVLHITVAVLFGYL